MADYLVTDTELTSVANAIRTKGGTSSTLSFPTGFVSAIGSISGGGIPVPIERGDVNFYDYDGSLVAVKSAAEINLMTSDSELPSNPVHTGLTAQGWNWTVAQLKAQLTAMPTQPINVGQLYVTSNGKTEIDCTFKDGRLSPMLGVGVNGTATIDWGDNTTSDTITGTSLDSSVNTSHTYASPGNYTISISVAEGTTLSFIGASKYCTLKKSTSDSSANNRVYANCIKAVRLGTGLTNIKTHAFNNCGSLETITLSSSITQILDSFGNCFSLKSITIPNGITSLSNSVFTYCYSLVTINLPSSIQTIGNSAFNCCYLLANITMPKDLTTFGESQFNNCYSLERIDIPSNALTLPTSIFQNCTSLKSVIFHGNLTTVGGTAFSGCNSLTNFDLPSSVQSLGTSSFSSCHGLTEINIPSDMTNLPKSVFYGCDDIATMVVPSKVTSIGDTAFSSCYGMKEYHIKPTSPPTLGTNVFRYMVTDCIIYVPYSADHSVLNNYMTDSGWSAYASNIQEEPAPTT